MHIFLFADFIRSAFAFNSDTESYVIVLFWKAKLKSHESWMSTFTTKSMEWSKPMICDHDIGLMMDINIHINGCLFWLAYIQGLIYAPNTNVICFDVINNKFSHIGLPRTHPESSWNLYEDDNFLTAVASVPPGGHSKSYEVWRRLQESDLNGYWVKILVIESILTMYPLIHYCDGGCIFAAADCKLIRRQKRCYRDIFYIGQQMRRKVRTIHGRLPIDFVIRSCHRFNSSLNIF